MNKTDSIISLSKAKISQALNGMALGLFSSLIIGLILKQLGILFHLQLLQQCGSIAQLLTGPAIGVGVAHALGGSPLALFSAITAGAIGANSITFDPLAIHIGEPIGAFLASVCAISICQLIEGRTKFDIFLIPLAAILVAGFLSQTITHPLQLLMTSIGDLINHATTLHPFLMGMVLAVSMGMILTLPISSAAIAITLGLDGLAAGAATVGCATQMIGFAIMSWRDNSLGNCLAQAFGTSMLQVPNIINNPKIWIPPILASAILGPLSTLVFMMKNNPIGAGMGTSGLVGQIATLDTMGGTALVPITLLHFFLPVILTITFHAILKKKEWIRPGDLAL